MCVYAKNFLSTQNILIVSKIYNEINNSNCTLILYKNEFNNNIYLKSMKDDYSTLLLNNGVISIIIGDMFDYSIYFFFFCIF